MPLRFKRAITRDMLKASPQTLWVFADNLVEWGIGAQASQMRGEKNAVGLPTKRFPAFTASAFLRDSDLPIVRAKTRLPRLYLARHLQCGGDAIWPNGGIGTGEARLITYAPAIFDWYCELQAGLQKIKPVPGASKDWIERRFAKHYSMIFGKRWK